VRKEAFTREIPNMPELEDLLPLASLGTWFPFETLGVLKAISASPRLS